MRSANCEDFDSKQKVEYACFFLSFVMIALHSEKFCGWVMKTSPCFFHMGAAQGVLRWGNIDCFSREFTMLWKYTYMNADYSSVLLLLIMTSFCFFQNHIRGDSITSMPLFRKWKNGVISKWEKNMLLAIETIRKYLTIITYLLHIL